MDTQSNCVASAFLIFFGTFDKSSLKDPERAMKGHRLIVFQPAKLIVIHCYPLIFFHVHPCSFIF